LARVHPTKGLQLLLDAWNLLERDLDGWELCVTGPDDSRYYAEMSRLAASMRLRGVRFIGPSYGRDKIARYQGADLYVLPTHSENFGITIAEALACGTPVITTRGAPWSRLEEKKCGWWIERDLKCLTDTLIEAMGKPREALKAMGLRGRQWMQEEYSWDRVGQRMSLFYRWLLRGGEPPEDVDICQHANICK
jgi:glycosyltransferase involved in cell wall biosynthesis